MKMVTKLSLFAMAMFTVGCNEKISPNLLESNVVTPGEGPTIIPSEYYFRITNTSPVLINFKLHKTGEGTSDLTKKSSLCQVASSSRLSSDSFRASPATNDINCFFEAEELSLYYSGFSFQMEASPNTCDYVAYSPFSYYTRRPGRSYGEYLQITKGSEKAVLADLTSEASSRSISLTYNGGFTAGWNQMLSDEIADGTRKVFSAVADDTQLCRFDYTRSGGPNCDEGTVTIKEFIVYKEDVSVNGVATTEVSSEVKTRIVRCGGRAANCIGGPIKAHSEISHLTKGRILTQAAFDEEVKIKYEYPSLIGISSGTFPYANFRRDLANSNIAYGTTDTNSVPYRSAFIDGSFNKIFDHKLLERYSRNRNYDQTTMIPTTTWDDYYTEDDTYTAVPLAAEPFVGMGSAYETNPFYTFFCLDKALDIKARINVLIRDWDRVFPENSSMEQLTDLGPDARQDVKPTDVEENNSFDDYNPFNDFQDWDDLMVMERVPLPALIYRPSPSNPDYPAGFFNPAIFPNE